MLDPRLWGGGGVGLKHDTCRSCSASKGNNKSQALSCLVRYGHNKNCCPRLSLDRSISHTVDPPNSAAVTGAR